jgi:hypothetical protein
MPEQSGIAEILAIAEALNEVCDLIEAAKVDDGKISLGDALRPAVWSSAMELYAACTLAVTNVSDLTDEIFDLDSTEIKAVLNRYVEVVTRLMQLIAS